MTRRPLNYTTQVAVRVTSAQCVALLADAGADQVALSYRDKQPDGLAFFLRTPHGNRAFRLPVNTDGVHKLLQAADLGTRTAPQWRSREHAARVAWRVAQDWLEAQVAIIDAGMATLSEVMLPYLQIEGRTIWERYQESEQLALTTGGPE